MYQQLMANNATWTVIDRGEPDSYFAIWDLIDYMGLGAIFEHECQLLRKVWEEVALSNDLSESELLSFVMNDYDEKKKIFRFVHSLIYCMVPTNKAMLFDAAVAEQFGRVVQAAMKKLIRVDYPIDFIEVGFNELDKELDSGTVERKFELIEENMGYELAKDLLFQINIEDRQNSFSYYTDTYTKAILEKGKLISCAIVMRFQISESLINNSSRF